MRRILSTYLFIHRKLTPELLGEIARAGVNGIELFCSNYHFNYRSTEAVTDLASILRDHNLTLQSFHAPTERDSGPRHHSGVPLSISDTERVRRTEAVDEMRRVLDLAEYIPYRCLVMHMGSSRDEPDPRRYEAAFSSLERLRLFAKQAGVMIALENTPGNLAAPERLRDFLTESRFTDIQFCFDVGHAHIGDGVMPSFKIMRDRIVTAHIHDNKGLHDEHAAPFSGEVEWAPLLAELKRIDSALVLEMKETPAFAEPAPPSVALEAVRAGFDKLEAALEAAPSGA